MSSQILITLKKRLEELVQYGAVNIEAQRNVLKEELQFYVLNFIYHHLEYSSWVMYGGSALRICHDLNRMSVDLDFEVDEKITREFLNKLKDELSDHFQDTYGIDSAQLTISLSNRGVTLKFLIGEELGLTLHSKQVHVKIDLNHFSAPKTIIERIPKNHGQLSFVIKTYNLSGLMASKIAAIFLRGQRGVGQALYEEKGRDIYDLLWYMSKKIIPDLDYLAAKDVQFADPKELFNKLTIKILNNENTDVNLRQDLPPLFLDQTFIEHWLMSWRESYIRLLEEYQIRTVTSLKNVSLHQDIMRGVFSFIYWYDAEDGKSVEVIYSISDYWIDNRDGDLSMKVSQKIEKLFDPKSNVMSSHPPSSDTLLQYAELFYQKTEKYFKKTNQVVLGDTITTKLIRMTADNLNQKEQILLNKSALLSCELDDLLK